MNRIVLSILVLLPLSLSSQVVSDAKLWTAVSVKKKVEKFTFFAGEEFRLDENFSHIDKVFTELGAEYEVFKDFEIGFAYRLSRDNDYSERSYDMKQRIDFSFGYKYKVSNFNIGFRNKIQTKPSDSKSNNPTYNRTKLTVKYDLDKDFEPYSYYEFYYQFNNQQVINRSRMSLGVKYDLNKDNAIKAFYIFENRFNTDDLEHNHIWGVAYSIDL